MICYVFSLDTVKESVHGVRQGWSGPRMELCISVRLSFPLMKICSILGGFSRCLHGTFGTGKSTSKHIQYVRRAAERSPAALTEFILIRLPLTSNSLAPRLCLIVLNLKVLFSQN